jgi:uncharacterized protein YegP (UPF0339 family)
MHYIVDIQERTDGRWRWEVTAPNGHSMMGGHEGDGYATPSGCIRALQDCARFFLRFGEELETWTAGGAPIEAGEILKIDGNVGGTRKPGLIVRVNRKAPDGA